MRKGLLLPLLLLTSLLGLGAIRGRVLDESRNGADGAACVLFSLPDSVYRAGALADSLGYFELPSPPTPDWYIHLTSLGSLPATVSSSTITVTTDETTGDVVISEPIVLANDATALQEVEVIGRRPELSIDNGVLTYNVDNFLATHKVTSAHELLLEMPLIQSPDGYKVELVGTTGSTKIYINGRPSKLNSTQLLSYLQSLPAKRIKNIEIIYIPTPKWGTTEPVINLMLNPALDYTLNGQLHGNYTYRYDSRYTMGASVLAAIPKLSLNVQYLFTDAHSLSRSTEDYTRYLDGRSVFLQDETKNHVARKNHSIYATAQYDINPSNSLEVNYSGVFIPTEKTDARMFNTLLGETSRYSHNNSTSNAVSLDYRYGRKVYAGIVFDDYHQTADASMVRSADEQVGLPSTDLHTTQKARSLRAYLDMDTPLGKGWSLSYGASWRHSQSDIFQAYVGNPEEEANYHSKDDQVSFYAGPSKLFLGGRLALNLSLSGSHYHAKGQNQFNVYPSFNATYYHSPSHIFQAQIGSMRYLLGLSMTEEYVNILNAYSYKIGNPALKPMNVYQGALVYFLKNKYVFTLTGSIQQRLLFSTPYPEKDDITLVYKEVNGEGRRSLGLSASVPFNIGTFYDGSFYAVGAYNYDKVIDWHGYDLRKRFLNAGCSLNNTFNLCARPRLRLIVSAWYYSPGRMYFMRTGSTWNLYGTLRCTLFDGALDMALNGTDLLNKASSWEKVSFPEYDLTNKSGYYGRSVYFTVTYNIKGYKPKQQKISTSDRFGL